MYFNSSGTRDNAFNFYPEKESQNEKISHLNFI